MKIGGAPAVVRQVWSVVSGVLKSKSSVVKGKAAHAMKSKIAVLGLIKNKKLYVAISQKMNSLFGHEESQSYSSNNMALTVYHASASDEMPCEVLQQCEQQLDYLSEAPSESDTPLVSTINSVCVTEDRLCRYSDVGQLEDEIDILADAFIRRFRAQMYLQKQDSFKRYRDMLNRSV